MSHSVILTSQNQNPNVPNQFLYRFPPTQSFKGQHQIALVQTSVYNSFFNIESSRGNTNITIEWNAATPTTHVFSFTPGFYSVSDMNYAIQNFCLLNKLYMEDTVNKSNVFFIELLTNAITYSAQINFYAIPTSAEATTNKWVAPTGSTWSFPTTAQCPQVTFNTQFGTLLGFNAATYPPTILNAKQQYLSQFAPTISPTSGIFLTCNLISSPYSNPSNILSTLPITSGFGDLILMKNSTPTYIDIIPGSYNEIEINLLNQAYENLTLRDKEVVIMLIIKEIPKK